MQIVVTIETDRIPVQSVAQREQFDADLRSYAEALMERYRATSMVNYSVRVEQID